MAFSSDSERPPSSATSALGVWRPAALLCAAALVAHLYPANGRAATSANRIDVCGAINADTTWTPANLYVITCEVTVAEGVTLTVMPGTVVKAYYGGYTPCAITVLGRLVAEGTAEAPIVFTSIKDDEHGGDTNSDLSATTPGPGDWQSINLEAGSSGSISNALIAYGGWWYWYDNPALVRCNDADIKLDRVTLRAGSRAALSTRRCSVEFTNGTMADNGSGLDIVGLAAGAPFTLANNVFGAGAAGTVHFDGNPHGPVSIHDNVAVDGKTGLNLRGTLKGDLDWHNDELVLLLVEGLTVAPEATVRLAPGSVVKSTLYDFGPGAIEVNGMLLAEGTPAAPIVFTSIYDDEHGGDTNADGSNITAGPGQWSGVTVNAGGAARIAHAEMLYGGNYYFFYGSNGLVRAIGGEVTLDDVTLRASGWNAIYADNGAVLVRGSRMEENYWNVRNNTPKVAVDARYNWWGDPSGPHHATKNPNGQGKDVTDGVLFFPWAVDEAGTVPSQVLVEGPVSVSAGATVDYAVSYYAGQDVADTILRLKLPSEVEYLGATGGGTYVPDSGEVFWPLGSVAAESAGTFSVRARFQSGLRTGVLSAARAQLEGSNLDSGDLDFDTAPYYAYTPPATVEPTLLSSAEIQPLIEAHAGANPFYLQALASGLKLAGGALWHVDASTEITEAVLVGRSGTQYISWQGQDVLSLKLQPGSAVFEDPNGGMSIDSGTGSVSYSGTWGSPGGGAAALDASPPSIGKGACFHNCLMQQGLDTVANPPLGTKEFVDPKGAVQEDLGIWLWPALNTEACQFVCVENNECGPCMMELRKSGIEKQKIRQCNSACEASESRGPYSCLDQLSGEPKHPMLICMSDRTRDNRWNVGVGVWRCDKETGGWRREEGDRFACQCPASNPADTQNQRGARCDQDGAVARCTTFPIDAPASALQKTCSAPKPPEVFIKGYEGQCTPERFAGYWGEGSGQSTNRSGVLLPPSGDVTSGTVTGCSEGGAAAQATAGSGACSESVTRVRAAHDPNAKSGPAGDVVPGQEMAYKVEFENEGEGTAYGVYVTDELSPHLDETTLELNNDQGKFFASTRSILWDVGDLAPKGQEGSKGERTFSVTVKPGLPSGTVITNQAIVYFPSVPEETATNTVVNAVEPLAALPQSLETPYGTPVGITLSGRDVSATPLTYAIQESPPNGKLTGTAPNLTYTPAENFTGQDRFTFTVSNGVSESRPADVTILVTPSSADTIAPQVAWTYPGNGAVIEEVSTAPVFTDDAGPVYAPSVQAGFSEAMDPATVSEATIGVTDGAGRPVNATVSWDGTVNQAVIAPREAWHYGSYTATVTAGVKDASGNTIAASYQWSFRMVPVTPACTGDCKGDGAVTVDELLTMVNVALGNAAVSECLAGDASGDEAITVDEILTAVNLALNGCP